MTPDDYIRDVLSRHPQAVEDEKLFLRGRGTELPAEDWPEWCGLPMAAVHAMLSAESSNPLGIARELPQLTAALLWRRSRIIYRYDPTLEAELAQQPLEGDLPRDALYTLPYHCVYIERRVTLRRTPYEGFFAWMEYDIPHRTPELRLLYLPKSDSEPISQPVILSGTLDDAAKALGQSAIERGGDMMTPSLRSMMQHNGAPTIVPGDEIRAAINLLLYLCSEAPDIPDAEEIRTKRSRYYDGTPKRPATADVGPRIGAALRQAASSPAPEYRPEAQHGHASPIPHIRRAHWHHFWAGARNSQDRRLILRWLPPTPVALSPNGEWQTTIRESK